MMQTLFPAPRFKNSGITKAFDSEGKTSQSRGGLPRVYSDVLPPAKGGLVLIKGDEFLHMTKVLRLAVDDRVELFNGKGGLVKGCIERVERGGLDVVAVEDLNLVPPQTHGTLKGGRADWLLEKCTELGASSITPLLTERYPTISNNRMDRLERVILAAAKQSQRLHEMTLNPSLKVASLLPMVGESSLSLIAVAEAAPILKVFASSPGRAATA